MRLEGLVNDLMGLLTVGSGTPCAPTAAEAAGSDVVCEPAEQKPALAASVVALQVGGLWPPGACTLLCPLLRGTVVDPLLRRDGESHYLVSFEPH